MPLNVQPLKESVYHIPLMSLAIYPSTYYQPDILLSHISCAAFLHSLFSNPLSLF